MGEIVEEMFGDVGRVLVVDAVGGEDVEEEGEKEEALHSNYIMAKLSFQCNLFFILGIK